MGSVNTRRQITCLPHAACWTLMLVTWGTVAAAQPSVSRIVIGTDVACRDEPHRDAPVVKGHQLGERLRNVSRVTVDGEEWYGTDLQWPRGCWTYGPLTVELDFRDSAAGLLAVAEHALALADAADFDHLVAVDNLLVAPWVRRLSPGAVPPMLALRHLQVVARAASRVRVNYRWALEPLQLAWVIGKFDVLEGPEIIGRFQVPASVYWELYERYADAPEAEILAWAAAQAPTRTDECGSTCILWLVERSVMRYWVAFPEGSYIVEALDRGAERLADASRDCVLYPSLTGPGIEEDIAQIRSSLDAITVSAKEVLLTHLDALDDWCGTDGVVNLDDARTIPRLVRAFGTRYSVSRYLAQHGEAAIPATLDAVDDDDSRVVAVALATLRLIVTADAGALSNDTAPAIQRAAERWLTASPQTSATLGAAIRLAGMTGDPGLLEIVETLATDSTAVAARGITDAQSVTNLQRLAAEQLADVPAVPRP